MGQSAAVLNTDQEAASKGATMKPKDILNILEDLKEDEFKSFKWYLEADKSIKWATLEMADRRTTVNLMIGAYRLVGAVDVTKKVLEEIKRNDLVQSLSAISSGPGVSVDINGAGQTAENSESSSSQSNDLIVPVPEPRPISFYQEMLQRNLEDRFMCAQEGLAQRKDRRRLDEVYTELYITAGGNIHINTEHEVRQVKPAERSDETENSVNPSDIFNPPSGKYKPIRTVLTSGIAGIGKTFLVHKFCSDWTTKGNNQDVHLLFPLTFRQLNIWREEKLSLTQLIHKCIRETRDIEKKALDHVFATLQSSGNTNYDKSKFKLLFVLDGLDESCLELDCSTNTNQETEFDVTESISVSTLLTNLINGNLLPSARLWITTRPAAASQIHSDFIDVVTEVRGFTDPQKKKYFRNKFGDEGQASRIISHIKTSRSLYIMCHIPVFCWITATVLKNVLKTKEELPKTQTEMYIHLLLVQFKLNNIKYDGGAETDLHWKMIESLGKLAFEQLQRGNLIFSKSDLLECGVDVTAAAVYSGVFTQIFTEERGLYEDKVFCFVHLSVQEFLAALHVHRTFIESGENLVSKQHVTRGSTSDPTRFYQTAVDQALKSPNGHLDLFLRFLLGLSLPANQKLLRDLVTPAESSSETSETMVKFIKKKIRANQSPERIINLFHCLHELNDHSLMEKIQQYLNSGRLCTYKLSPAQWSALAFFLLSSEEDLDVFDLREYSASEEALLRLLPVVRTSKKALLSGCHLSERSCEALASALSSESCSLKELDLSNNDLQDRGVKLLSVGLESPQCRLETLRLSGCLITEKGCRSLASVLRSNCHLKTLDLRYNHLGDSGAKLVSAELKDPRFPPRLDHSGEKWLQTGLRKYACGLTVDTDTVNRFLKLSDNNRKVTAVSERQPYHHHPQRFTFWEQLLCGNGLTGRCYWEVEWSGLVYISVSYRGMKRRAATADCWFGRNKQSWSLRCSDGAEYCVYHNKIKTPLSSSASSSAPHRVAVYVDRPGGTLSFYTVSCDTLVHLYTFSTRFTEPPYPGFGFGFQRSSCSSVSLCSLETGDSLPV